MEKVTHSQPTLVTIYFQNRSLVVNRIELYQTFIQNKIKIQIFNI